MNYKEALEYIHNTLKFGIKLGLNNMGSLLELMGNPQKELKYVHVAGTNGKGSTVAFISSILMEAGYKVGIYTSPYLERFTERIKINLDEISENELCEITEFVKSKVDLMISRGENHPTEFEIVTAIAFQYYFQQKCDIVVLEVGLGGRFDSTNIIETPEVAVITTISYDHMNILGDTLPKIAYEKAGIIKKNGDVVLYPQEEVVTDVFKLCAADLDAKLNMVDFSEITILKFDITGQRFDFQQYKALETSLLGEHQVKNAVMAIKTAEILSRKGYKISKTAIENGIRKTKWTGRFEVLNKNPMFLIDGAHNEECAKVLAQTLENYFPNKNKIFIIGILKDKDYMAVIKTIVPLASQVIAVTPNSPRALDGRELALIASDYCKNVLVSDTIEEAVRSSIQMASEADIVCAFGSFTHIGVIREMFIKKEISF